MKYIIFFSIYLFAFSSLYIMLSMIAMIWNEDISLVLTNNEWFIVYSLFIGSWAAAIPAIEYGQKHKLI